ncbi:hypothetical protein ZWY2020_024936 [Hordeum vulgare]|nr:hypothetical protein ZWY2020_024936 [Hordeum vulgare]
MRSPSSLREKALVNECFNVIIMKPSCTQQVCYFNQVIEEGRSKLQGWSFTNTPASSTHRQAWTMLVGRSRHTNSPRRSNEFIINLPASPSSAGENPTTPRGTPSGAKDIASNASIKQGEAESLISLAYAENQYFGRGDLHTPSSKRLLQGGFATPSPRDAVVSSRFDRAGARNAVAAASSPARRPPSSIPSASLLPAVFRAGSAA